jgi:hypothetical protein
MVAALSQSHPSRRVSCLGVCLGPWGLSFKLPRYSKSSTRPAVLTESDLCLGCSVPLRSDSVLIKNLIQQRALQRARKFFTNGAVVYTVAATKHPKSGHTRSTRARGTRMQGRAISPHARARNARTPAHTNAQTTGAECKQHFCFC